MISVDCNLNIRLNSFKATPERSCAVLLSVGSPFDLNSAEGRFCANAGTFDLLLRLVFVFAREINKESP